MEQKRKMSLSDIPKKDVFKTPAGYFESLPERVDQRITGERGKQVFMNPTWKYVSLAAAVVAILIISLPLMRTAPVAPTAEHLLSQIDAADCLLYLRQTDIEALEILDNIDSEGLFEDSDVLHQAPLEDEDLDMLYERYGVTDDEKLQTL